METSSNSLRPLALSQMEVGGHSSKNLRETPRWVRCWESVLEKKQQMTSSGQRERWRICPCTPGSFLSFLSQADKGSFCSGCISHTEYWGLPLAGLVLPHSKAAIRVFPLQAFLSDLFPRLWNQDKVHCEHEAEGLSPGTKASAGMLTQQRGTSSSHMCSLFLQEASWGWSMKWSQQREPEPNLQLLSSICISVIGHCSLTKITRVQCRGSDPCRMGYREDYGASILARLPNQVIWGLRKLTFSRHAKQKPGTLKKTK